ncbi:hypothetical protein HD598_001826 [Neomicrococcus aestuarii]|uniref:Uncharacterized protein n=1 Tax=Neomicrococcus aestuarii TaxID=556325 RepID=A0A7W8X1T4_9MICC|nr:hypothetical protein [Neomicrococcus aestuarii]MBB5513139.1 hypothetical protein [Neomicrococcus aestuarii]
MPSLKDRKTLERVRAQRADSQRSISPREDEIKNDAATGLRLINSFKNKAVGRAVLLSGISPEDARRLGAV